MNIFFPMSKPTPVFEKGYLHPRTFRFPYLYTKSTEKFHNQRFLRYYLIMVRKTVVTYLTSDTRSLPEFILWRLYGSLMIGKKDESLFP